MALFIKKRAFWYLVFFLNICDITWSFNIAFAVIKPHIYIQYYNYSLFLTFFMVLKT